MPSIFSCLDSNHLRSLTVSLAPEVRWAEVVRVVSLRVTLAAGGQRPLARAVLRSAAVITHASCVTCHAAHLTRLARGAEAVRVGGGGVAVAAARQADALHARGVRGARGVGLGSRGVTVAAGGEGGLAGAVLARQ